MIKKIIHTIWLNESKELPPTIAKCIPTHNIPGYQHNLITLDNCYKESRYVNECIKNKDWVRAADYLRLYYLNKEGGIYLDADVEVLNHLNGFLGKRMFVGKEHNGYLSNAIIGSEPNHPFLKYVLNTMERNFKTDSHVFDSGMQFFAEAYYIADREGLGMHIYEPDVFFPKKNHTNILHHFTKSWIKQHATTTI